MQHFSRTAIGQFVKTSSRVDTRAPQVRLKSINWCLTVRPDRLNKRAAECDLTHGRPIPSRALYPLPLEIEEKSQPALPTTWRRPTSDCSLDQPVPDSDRRRTEWLLLLSLTLILTMV